MYRRRICAFWLRCSEGCISKKSCSQISKRNFNSFTPQFWWIQPLVTFSKPPNRRNNRRATCSLTASAQRERRSNFKTVTHSHRSLQSQSWVTTRWTSNLWWSTPLIGQSASSLATTHWQLFRKISCRVYEAWIPDKSAARRYPCSFTPTTWTRPRCIMMALHLLPPQFVSIRMQKEIISRSFDN